MWIDLMTLFDQSYYSPFYYKPAKRDSYPGLPPNPYPDLFVFTYRIRNIGHLNN